MNYYQFRNLVILFSFTGFSFPNYAVTLDKGGLGESEGCYQFHAYKVNMNASLGISKTKTQYSFNATVEAGLSGCSKWSKPYPATAIASWDESTKKATEEIKHGSPVHTISHITVSCPKDPWVHNVSCSLDSAKNTKVSDKGFDYGFKGSFPVSASLMTLDQKKKLGGTPYQDFVLPPNTPPVIVSPVADGIYRNSPFVKIHISRPRDGDSKWYEGRKIEFDIEFQVNKNASFKSGSGLDLPKTMGMMWITVSPGLLGIPTVLSTTEVNAPLDKFVAQGPSGSEVYQDWRIRTRLKDTTTVRPWTPWQPFFVVTPKSFDKMPDKPGFKIDIDKSKMGTDKSAPIKPMNPVAPLSVPSPTPIPVAPQPNQIAPQPGVQVPNNITPVAPAGSTQRNIERLSR